MPAAILVGEVELEFFHRGGEYGGSRAKAYVEELSERIRIVGCLDLRFLELLSTINCVSIG